ncbi:hypothetical protein C8R44DRAFT_894773 [Mycena epipterygia]|nr:hypothetical protein C8R44DRAFT_894773 [Mycena epipterygia]
MIASSGQTRSSRCGPRTGTRPRSPNTPGLPSFAPLRAAAPPFAGLLGLHVRRGDYEEHCKKLVTWETDYNAWNLLGRPEFHPHSAALSAKSNNNSALGTANINGHGHSTANEDGHRANPGRTNARTTGDQDVYPQLPDHFTVPPGTNRSAAAFAHCWPSAEAILQADGWARVASSLDLALSRDEWAVGNAVDMGVLVGAEAFVGVG